MQQLASWLSKRKSQTESESELCLQQQLVSVKFLYRKLKGEKGLNFQYHRKFNSGWDFGISEGNECELTAPDEQRFRYSR